jgi:hypothetical protein
LNEIAKANNIDRSKMGIKSSLIDVAVYVATPLGKAIVTRK